MEIVVNGQPRQALVGSTLQDLIVGLGLRPEGVVAEHNTLIVERTLYAQTPMNAGDVVELVNFVGGG